MSSLQALYDSKRMMPTDAAGLVRDGDTVKVVPTGGRAARAAARAPRAATSCTTSR